MKKKGGPGTFSGTLAEIRDGKYLANARNRSSRRKSKWNLLLPLVIFPIWILLWWVMIEFGCLASFLLHGTAVPAIGEWMKILGPGPMTLGGALIALPPFVPTMTAAMVIGNFLVYLIPPARRAMDAEDQGFPGTEYATAQSSLGRATVYTAPVVLFLSLLGAWLIG